MSLKTGHFYDFGDFRLDPGERVLLRGGKPVAVTPKALHLLSILVEHRGRVLEKERLMQEIWADSFVEDGNLAVSAAMLRKVLADDAGHPTFIETVPRRGYRFIAEVIEVVPEDDPPTVATGTPPARLSRKTHYAVIGAFLAVAVAGIAVLSLKYGMSGLNGAGAPILSAPFASTRFSTSGTVPNAVISPDGKYAAFIDTAGGDQGLWLRQIESGENIPIVPASRDHYLGLAFSSGGQSIYFIRMSGTDHGTPTLYRVNAFGGIPVRILDGLQRWMDTSPDDGTVSFIRCSYRPDDHCSLFLADADGQNERRIFTRPEPIIIASNQFSPDGKTIAVAHGQYLSGEPDFHISLIDVASGLETEMSTQRFFDIKGLQWLPGGDSLLFTVRDFDDGQISIWKTRVAGGPAEPVTKDAASYQELSLDRDGEKMIATQVDNDFRLYRGAGGDWTPADAARDAAVAADGRVVYSTLDGDLWVGNGDGSGRYQVTSGPAGDQYPRFSGDGHRIFFRSNRSGTMQIWRTEVDGTGLKQISNSPGGYPCSVSADGAWLYYTRDKKLHRMPADGGEGVLVSDRKLLWPVCSPDGGYVAYFLLDGGFKIAAMSTADGKVERTFPLEGDARMPVRLAWSPDAKSIYFIAENAGKKTLWHRPRDASASTKIADLGSEDIRDLEVLPDGKGFLIVRGKWINDAVMITGLK